MGGTFRGRAPQIIACSSQARNVPQSEDCAPKESKDHNTAGWFFEAVPPHIAACVSQK